MPILEHFIENDPKDNAFNITPDKSIELLQVAELVKRISGKDIEINVAQEGLGMEYSGDNSRLKAEIKSVVFMPIEDSVEELYDWYLKNKNSLNKDLLMSDK